VVLLCVLAAACTPEPDGDTGVERPRLEAGASEAGSEPVATIEGGRAIVATTEPPTLNPWLASPDSGVGMIVRPMLAPLWRVRPDGTFEPWLLAGEPTVAGGDNEPFSVTYRIRDEAVWSDGQPIDGRDVLFTLETCLRTAPRTDCTAVDLERSQAAGKLVTVVFTRPTAAWRTVLSSMPVLPEHELRGRELATMWTWQISVSSGPFRFGSWTPGERLVLVRNDNWWGEPPPLDSIDFRFTGDAAVPEVAEGMVDVVSLPASPALIDQARAEPRVRARVETGRRWAALDFNIASRVLREPQIRRALAQAIDRATIVAELIQPVDPEAGVLAQWPGGPAPADDQAPVFPEHDASAAARALDAAGCPVGPDGIRVCGDQRMELDLVTTDDDWQQSIVGEYVQSQLADIGVDVRYDPPPEGALSQDTSKTTGQATSWDLRVTAVPAAADLTITANRWHCDHPANTQSFCDTQFDTTVQRATETLESQERADLDNEAVVLLSRALPTYPLYEIPAMVVHASSIRGPAPNPGPWGPTWNVEQWVHIADEMR
jgi:peptide/nickel transport system substrate-binding protein